VLQAGEPGLRMPAGVQNGDDNDQVFQQPEDDPIREAVD
jgi:hypothetical protein